MSQKYMPTTKAKTKIIKEALKQIKPGIFIGDLKQNVGMLRQWLNEDRIKDPARFVTNEELNHWLGLGPPPRQDR